MAELDIDDQISHAGERHADGSVASRLNWLRAGVLGANDGILSISGLVVGVAAATTDVAAIATAGVAGLVAGAVSMGIGEYVSVSTQRDTEAALIAEETRELEELPDHELEELTGLLRSRGLTEATARTAAVEMTVHDALGTHLHFELGIDAEELTNPWHAAFSSAIAFTLGALIPLVAVLLPPPSLRIPVCFAGVLLALLLAGSVSASLGGSPRRTAVLRLVTSGAIAMAVTYGIGALLGVTVA